MSWETLVVGHLKVKKENGEQVQKLLDELESVLECKVTYDKKFNEYCFCDVNWVSHVHGKKIKDVMDRYKDIVEYFDCSIYYLSEADESLLYDNGWKEEVVYEL